jgi:hypothetical protein
MSAASAARKKQGPQMTTASLHVFKRRLTALVMRRRHQANIFRESLYNAPDGHCHRC